MLCLICLFVYITAPGSLKIQMMHKQHVVEEIQKLMDYEEYMEVLVAPPSAPAPDPGQQQQPQPGTSQDDTQSSAVQPPAKKQRPTKAGKSPRRKATDKVKSGPFVEGTKPTAVPRFGDIGRFQAEPYNLCNLQQVIELSEYLHKNGNWELFLFHKFFSLLFNKFPFLS